VAAGVLSAGHARALLGLPDGGGNGAAGPADRRRGPVGAQTVEEIVALGDDADVPAVTRTLATVVPRPELDDLAGRLSDFLDTRASIALGKTKGKVTIEFACVEDLNRILAAIGYDNGARP
jgi:ParB family chromosome partitioning protein